MNGYRLWLFYCLLLPLSVYAKDNNVTVLTSLQVTYSIGSSLAEGTNIKVKNMTDVRTRMARHESKFKKNPEQFTKMAKAADAVITIRSVWLADPLFPYARETISSTISKGGFPPLILQPINFDALYAQTVAEKTAN